MHSHTYAGSIRHLLVSRRRHIFFLCLVRLLSQPDFYRILINFISILCAYICRYEFWIFLSITPWAEAVQSHCFFHRFTTLFSGILLFNLKKKKSFCGWEHFEKVQIHASCNALKDVKKNTQKHTYTHTNDIRETAKTGRWMILVHIQKCACNLIALVVTTPLL